VLFRLATPLTIGLLSIFFFNLADTYFVAQLGTRQLAAMSFTFPVVMVLLGYRLP
jgi:Na+-driven multidrug efflux pump